MDNLPPPVQNIVLNKFRDLLAGDLYTIMRYDQLQVPDSLTNKKEFFPPKKGKGGMLENNQPPTKSKTRPGTSKIIDEEPEAEENDSPGEEEPIFDENQPGPSGTQIIVESGSESESESESEPESDWEEPPEYDGIKLRSGKQIQVLEQKPPKPPRKKVRFATTQPSNENTPSTPPRKRRKRRNRVIPR